MENIQEITEIINPKKSALVIWDVQKMLVNNIFNREEFLTNTKFLIAAAREKGVPIFFTKITPLPEQFESPAKKFFMKNRPRGFAFTPDGLDLAITPKEEDVVLNKNTASIFVGTNFELVMRNAGLSTVIFSGISTEIGVESSARDALNRGFFPVIVTDAVSSSNQDAHTRSLQNLKNMMVLLSANDLISLWKNG
ncbi:MAG: cysteine hydrolase [Bacteroidetes bacterium]|nr:cysteine hydrolase [Bacteroidota bacterium]MCL5737634.1 cysteine hydrolase [Bacteroidota bacterium]